MKRLIKKVLTISLIALMLNSISFAGDRVSFRYNVLPHDENETIIDSKANDQLIFDLWETEENICVNGEEIEIVDDTFEVDITNLFGKQSFVMRNDKDEEVTFTYYISDEDGLVKNYKSKEFGNYDVYVKTVDDIKILYTKKDFNSVEKVVECLNNMPEQTKSNLKEIKLLPKKSRGNVAGVTNYDKITLYGLSKYDESTIENIVYHEVAHTWAYELIREKILDFSYSTYKDVVEEDNNFVSNYSKKAIKKSSDYSEDFAESVAFYLMDAERFESKYTARAEFLNSILE